MPLMRYFVFVGGALFALLLIVNACLPASPPAERSHSAVDLSVIRIHSENKWPERVVFDTSRPAIAPVPPPTAVAAAETALPQTSAAAAPQDRVREAFAQLTPNPSRLEPKRKRKSVAKNSAGPPRLLVAQQRPVAFYTTW